MRNSIDQWCKPKDQQWIGLDQRSNAKDQWGIVKIKGVTWEISWKQQGLA